MTMRSMVSTRASESSIEAVSCTVHDDVPHDEAQIVGHGLTIANDRAAPLHEVRPLSCFARHDSGSVIGGAIGRSWGACGELQQLWVDEAFRRRGIGGQLVRAFEARASERGCTTFFLETFSFQAPQFYRSLGYEVAYEHAVYPHGIVRYMMIRRSEIER